MMADMACKEKGCTFPELRNGLCVQHLRRLEEDIKSKINVPRGISPLQLVKTQDAVAAVRSVTEENGWIWDYLKETEADIWKHFAPVWGWLYRAVSDLPKGECVKLKVPDGKDFKKTRRMVSSVVRQQFPKSRWSIRTGSDYKHLVIFFVGTWDERQKELKDRAKGGDED